MKPVIWLGDSLFVVRRLPKSIRQDIGFELERVQNGLTPRDARSMAAVGPGVAEIRLHGATEHRVFYVAKFSSAVYVLHAFTKKTQRTAVRDIALGQQRYAEALRREGHQ